VIFTWTSADNQVASVDVAGLVTGVAPGGPVTITASGGGSSGTASVTVTPPPVASVTVEPAEGSVHVAWTLQLTATLRDAAGNILTGRTVTWSSDNTSLATVSSDGLVTGVAAGGPVTITATSEGVSGTAAITVTLAPVETVEVTPATSTVQVGGTRQLTATLRDANGNVLTGRAVSWSSSDAAIATVSQSGLVTGVVVGGPVTITASSEGKSGTAEVTVTSPTPPPPPSGCQGFLVSGTIASAGQVDTYTFSGTTGHFITLTLARTSGFPSFGQEPRVTLIAPSNTIVDFFDAHNQRNYTLEESGTFVLRVNANNFVATGSYSLSMSCIRPSPDAVGIGYGDLVGGSLASAQVDLYTFTGTASEFITVTLARTSGFPSFGQEPRVCLIAPSDTIVECFDANAQRNYTLGESGTFVLRVNANNFVTTGSYALGLESIRPPSPDAVGISYGDLVGGSLASAQVDLYTFTGTASEFITVTLARTSGFPSFGQEPRVCLIAPSDTIVECFDANAQRNYTLGESGTFVLRVNANNFVTTGSYALGLSLIAP
jgi:uncharacterized protein YjdB